MAADRSRLAAALAYKQAEEERRRRMMESIPTPAGTTPAEPAPQADFRTNLENLSIGVGEGLTNQLEGIKGLVTDPVGTAKGVYEAGKAVVRDPAIIASALRQIGQKAMSGPLGAGEVIGEMIGPRKTGPVMAELDVYHGTPHRFPATEANPLGEFDASKIGTGKGRNLKGKGIYLTENPERAKEYAESFVEPGFVYKSDLPDEMIEMMLEYDVPIKNQPEKIKKALKTLGIDPESSELAGTMVSGLREGKNLIAEETFVKAGIPGMKVKNIRAKEKKYDFVVFPGEEKKVRILERNGQKAPPQKIAQALEAIKPVKTQAKAGGEIAESNGYFYKGGQFLPSTEAEPGRWKIGKKVVTTKQEVIAPGEMAVQPTPFSRSIYQAALGQGDWVTKTPEGLKVRENIKTSTGELVTPDMKIRLGVKGVLGKEELTLQEFVDAYNKGQRWFDVQPDAPVVRSK